MRRRNPDAEAIRRIKGVVTRVESQPYAFGPSRRQPRLGAGAADLWCQLSGSLGPATGTWPNLTATSTTANVYRGVGTSLVLVTSSATIYNRRNVTWSPNKTTFLAPSGGGFAIIDQDC